MIKVHKQIEMLRSLLDELDRKTNERSCFKKLSLPQRVIEAQAIEASAHALVAITKRATPIE
jgi:hypothetical protein